MRGGEEERGRGEEERGGISAGWFAHTDPSTRDREIGSKEELRAELNFKSHKILRVYCVISLPEDRGVFVCSRTARIAVNTGEEGGREGGREEEGVRWEVLGNSYHMYVLLKRRVASNS